MSRQPDENDQLAGLLRMLPAPEPSAEFASSVRRRYREAIEARVRREALTGFMASLIGLVAIAVLSSTVIEPAALVVWFAEAVADLARWTAGIGVVLALVPPVVWAPVVLGSAASLLTSVLVTRARSQTLAK